MLLSADFDMNTVRFERESGFELKCSGCLSTHHPTKYAFCAEQE